MTQLVGRWLFDVELDETGELHTYWTVWEGYDDEPVTRGVVAGPLQDAIFEAYDALGITCPLVPDPDLLALGRFDRKDDEWPSSSTNS